MMLTGGPTLLALIAAVLSQSPLKKIPLVILIAFLDWFGWSVVSWVLSIVLLSCSTRELQACSVCSSGVSTLSSSPTRPSSA